MPALPIASATAAIFAMAVVVLSFIVSLRRVKLGVTFGEGDDRTLRRRVRAHGNFIEYAPLALGCVCLMELQALPPTWVLAAASAFVGTRLLHALGMLFVRSPIPRAAAMLIQHATFIACAVALLAH